MIKKVGRYQVIEELGRGGMASVYKAIDTRMEREVALKILPEAFKHDPTFRARFELEAKTIANLEHPAIVPVHDYGEEDGEMFLVMRYMKGGTLGEKLKSGGLGLEEAIRILERLAPALDLAHSKGIIHRDLKPANILFDKYDEPYIADFGLVKLSEGSAALTGSAIIGTPAYMSPEQVEGKVELDGRSDVYSLGLILYEMLSGKQPFEADTPVGLLVAHLNEPPPEIRDSNPEISVDISRVLSDALSKNRDDRMATAMDLVDKLNQSSDWRVVQTHIDANKNSIENEKIVSNDINSVENKVTNKWYWIGAVAILVLITVLSFGDFGKGSDNSLSEDIEQHSSPVFTEVLNTEKESEIEIIEISFPDWGQMAISIDVPGIAGEQRVVINDHEYECNYWPDYSERLYCFGSSQPISGEAVIYGYLIDDDSLTFEYLFMIPGTPTPAVDGGANYCVDPFGYISGECEHEFACSVVSEKIDFSKLDEYCQSLFVESKGSVFGTNPDDWQDCGCNYMP